MLSRSLIPLRRQEKLRRKGIKSQVRDIIKPGDKRYGHYNKGKPQLFKYGATLVATQHRKATRRVTRRGRRKFEKRGFSVNKVYRLRMVVLRGSLLHDLRGRRRESRRKPDRKPLQQEIDGEEFRFRLSTET